MKSISVLILLAISLLLSHPTYAINTLKSAQDIVSTLEQSAQICAQDCQKVCIQEAQRLSKLGMVDGHQQAFQQGAERCRQKLSKDSKAKSSPKKMELYMTLVMVDSMLSLIAKAENTQSAASKNVATAPTVDTQIYDASGILDMSKVQQLFSFLPQFCDSALNTNDESTLRTCRNQCQDETTSLNKTTEEYAQNVQKHKSATGLDTISYAGAMAANLQKLQRLLSKQGNCLGILQGYFKKEPTPEAYTVLFTAGQEIKAGKWPPKEAPSLSLAGLSEEKPVSIFELSKQIKAVDAPQKFSWKEARDKIKQSEEFQRMEQQVKKNGFSLSQLKQAMTDLKGLKETANKLEWKKKAAQFSDLGSMAELVAAVNQNCDKAYLSQFNADNIWHNPNKVLSFNPDPKGNNINYLIEPVHLQRLCYEELQEQIQSEYDQATNPAALMTLTEKYLSQPPLDGRATCRDCAPSRAMSAQQWLPSGQAYLDKRNQQFAQQQQQQEQAAQQQAALLAKQHAEQEAGERQQQLAQARDEAAQSILAFINADYPSVIEQSHLYVKPDYADEKNWQNSKRSTKQSLQNLAKITKARATFSQELLQHADKTHMLDSFIQLASNQLKTAQNQDPNRRSKEKPARLSPEAITPLPNSRLKLKALTSCMGAAPLLDTFIKQPLKLTGQQFILMEHMLQECNAMFGFSVTLIRNQPGGKVQSDLYKQIVAPHLKPKKLGSDPKFAQNLIRAMAAKIDTGLAKSGLTGSTDRQLNRYLVQFADKFAQQQIARLIDENYAQITGKTPKSLSQLAVQKFDQHNAQIAQVKQQAKGQPLPSAPYQFDLLEAYVILDTINRSDWKCTQRNLQEISNVSSFIGNLHYCGYASKNAQFKTFTDQYRNAYRQANR